MEDHHKLIEFSVVCCFFCPPQADNFAVFRFLFTFLHVSRAISLVSERTFSTLSKNSTYSWIFSSENVEFFEKFHISLSDLRWSEIPIKFGEDFFPARILVSGVLKTFWKHQESIPGKVLMKSYAPVFFSSFIFSSQKMILETPIGKISPYFRFPLGKPNFPL